MYKSGQPVHTIAIGILRGNTFDMYYKGRILEKYAESFGAMSYDTTIAGRACELYKKEERSYLHLFSREKINEEFDFILESVETGVNNNYLNRLLCLSLHRHASKEQLEKGKILLGKLLTSDQCDLQNLNGLLLIIQGKI